MTNPQNPRVETPQEICEDLLLASNYIGQRAAWFHGRLRLLVHRGGEHGSPDEARDTAFQKIKSRVEGTRMASEKLGLARAA